MTTPLFDKRHKRLSILRELILENKFKEQSALLAALKEKNIDTNQATLSRDLQHLQVRKRDGHYTLLQNAYIEKTKHYIALKAPPISISENFLLLKTRPGHASSMAFEIDKWKHHDVAGTIAGDDCVLIILYQGKKEIQDTISQIVLEHFTLEDDQSMEFGR